jgi:uncharacterized protein YndB with AHSA1/START domain
MEVLEITPVRKAVTVQADAARAFRVFTEGFDTWWPRSHHIGKSPMTKGILEGRVGGRCYSEQEDGTECDWGSILVWEPPHRLVIAWKITSEWGYEADPAKSSEVEIIFRQQGDGATRVELEHRHLERHGAGAAAIRTGIDSEGGWGMLLRLFGDKVDQTQ